MEHRPSILSLPGGEELGHAAPGAIEVFPTQAMERATGSRRIEGNSLRLQFEGTSTFEAWIEAIQAAERFVYFENYILRDDRVGRAFRDALVSKALEGVPVYLIYDWFGCWATPGRYWKPFREAGVHVRAFNRPRIRDPLGILQRDHRKLVCVDGDVAYVGGFCIGKEWAVLLTAPLPNCPSRLLPQHQAVWSVLIPQVWMKLASMESQPVPSTLTGVLDQPSSLPVPKEPYSLSPQHHADPSLVTPHAYL